MNRILFLLAATLAAGCSESDSAGTVAPVAMTEEAVGYYCQMNVLDHDGPKAQIHLADKGHPIWFVQIRDAFAYDRMPEQPAQVTAIFVNDMGAPGAEWERPGKDNWIPATSAFYVVGSDRKGGMGAPDLIPFAREDAAGAFARRYGGSVIAYADVTDEAILAPVDVELPNDADEPGENGS